jgi:hypothetical protein
MTEIGMKTSDPGRVTMVEGFVNSALDEIAIATDWTVFKARDTFSTEIGEDQYTLPVGGREIIQLRYTDTGEAIDLWTEQEAARRSFKLEDPGRAYFWLEDGNLIDSGNVLYQFRLAPVPNSELEIEVSYYYHPSQVASADPLPIPDSLIVLVKDRTRAYLLVRDEKYQAATIHLRNYEKGLERLVKQENRPTAKETRVKPSIPGRGRRWGGPRFDPAHYRN